MEREELDRALASGRSEEERLAIFGALLAKESKLGRRLILVGGAAIEIYLSSDRYVSQDIDVVGEKEAIRPVLRKWGFEPEEGRDRRLYWSKAGLGKVDLVGAVDRSGLRPTRKETPYGAVYLGPVEYLIVRRLMRAGRERSVELFRQAEVLAAENASTLDWGYIRIQAKYEGVLPLYEQLREQVGPVSSQRVGRE
ncbi:MAG TPA: hypothetical protein VMG99_06445 [Thermoplasmata archaeon]|jgi:hypothetical protein|nr:hypothetical protein [Thermoplasmata archaeon]